MSPVGEDDDVINRTDDVTRNDVTTLDEQVQTRLEVEEEEERKKREEAEEEEKRRKKKEEEEEKRREDLGTLLDLCQKKLEVVEKENADLKEQFRASEKEKAELRRNIRKVSENWFERKSRNSENSDADEAQSSALVLLEGQGGREVPRRSTRVALGREGKRRRERAGGLDVDGGSVGMMDLEGDDGGDVGDIGGVGEAEGEPEAQVLLERLKDIPRLLTEVSFQAYKVKITERICRELRKRVKDYESVIDDQDEVIQGLKQQLGTYFEDNHRMAQQLSSFSKIFEDLERSERTSVGTVESDSSSSIAPVQLPTLPDQAELQKMSSSLSRTYIKLKDLILEKKSLVTEIDRLKILNLELQRRVEQQESRLEGVSNALRETWLIVSNLKDEHSRIHTSESILRYELKGKRELLQKLKDELECSRGEWHKIRRMNLECEEEWNSIKDELNERRRIAETPGREEEEEEEGGEEEREIEGATARPPPPASPSNFEPPVDLLLDMAVEYGLIDPEDETTTTLVATLEGEDLHHTRLRHLEDQCSFLYQKLVASTSRSLVLASRLTQLHQQYGDEDDEDDDDDDEDDDDYEDDDDFNLHEIPLEESDSSNDTAYVSEDAGSLGASEEVALEEQVALGGEGTSPDLKEDLNGDLSKRLINFLPRKIDFLRRENLKLEEKLNLVLEEKEQLKADLEKEKMTRKQIEDQLQHLGKCVDELKLERNGQIAEVEGKLKQKVASLSQREAEYTKLEADLESLREKFEERGIIVNAANERVKELETALKQSERSVKEYQNKLHLATQESNELVTAHNDLTNNYRGLQQDLLTIQQETADLREQLTKQLMEEKQRRDVKENEIMEENGKLREKIVQLLQRRVRVCDECFDTQAELAAIIASPALPLSAECHTEASITSQQALKKEDKEDKEEEEEEEEGFNMISEDEVERSRLGSTSSEEEEEEEVEGQVKGHVEVKEKTQAEMMTLERLREKPPVDEEFWLSAGRMYILPLSLPNGVTVRWQFSSEPKSISFAVLHQPPADEENGPKTTENGARSKESQEASTGASRSAPTRVLVPATRVADARGVGVNGRLATKVPGVYSLVFDNSFARYTAKKITYTLTLEE